MNMFKRKGKSTGFDFYLHIHTLSPWPSKYKAVYVEWSRGSSHKGVLKPAGPTSQGNGQVASFDFDEGIHVPCTLYTVRPRCPLAMLNDSACGQISAW